MSRAALVLVDLQRDVLHAQPARVRELLESANVVTHCAAAAEAAHRVGIPVVWVTVLRRANGADAVTNRTGMPAASGPARLVEGTEGAELVADLPVAPDDLVVVKRRRSAFVGTELDWLLRHRGVDTVLLGGVATNWGVESTARSAYDLGYDVVVLPDCCAGFTAEDHDFALRRIFPNMARVLPGPAAIAEYRPEGDH